MILPANGGFDWSRLTGVALFENSVTVLNDRVATLPASRIPADVRDRIGRLALIWTFKLQTLERRLRESVRILAAAGIEVTILKGAALALTRYPRFIDRPMADLDLMVDPTRAKEAHELLRKSGWALETASRSPDAWSAHHHLPPLADTAGSGLRLELHVAPLPPGHPFRLSLEDVVATSSQIDLDGITARVPEPHLHAVHAAIHFAYSHQFTSGALNVFRDLAMLTDRGALNWEKFAAVARQTDSESSCYWTLRLARSFGALAVPTDVLKELSPALGERALSILEQHFSQLILRADHACPSVELRRRLWTFALQIRGSHSVPSAHWDEQGPSDSTRTSGSTLKRLGSHFRRANTWSRYVASLVAPALELSA